MTTKRRKKSSNTRKVHRKRRGLQGVADVELSPMLNDAKRPLAVAGGILLGGMITEKLTPMLFEAVNAGTQGLMGMKVPQNVYDAAKIGIPVVLGLVGYQLATSQIMRDAAIGVATYGATQVVQQATTKFGLKLSGFGDATADDYLHNAPADDYLYNAPVELPQLQARPISNYTPALRATEEFVSIS